MDAYLTGLEAARDAGLDLGRIQSVASFFVSRVDTEYDKRLDAIGTDEATALKSKAAIANARLAYELFEADKIGLANATTETVDFAAAPPRAAGTIVKDEGDGGTKLAEFLSAQKFL